MDKLRIDEKCLTGFLSNASYLVEKMDVFGGVGFPGVYRRGGQRPDPGGSPHPPLSAMARDPPLSAMARAAEPPRTHRA